MYKGTLINEVPLDYLIWLFPGLRNNQKEQPLFTAILEYFLSRDIRVEDHTNKSQGYHFYFNDYVNPDIIDGERPFLQSFWRMKNSKDEFVYEVGNNKNPIYFEEKNEKFEISTNYISHNFRFGGLTMVYEKNPEFYFYDGFGKIMKGAFLMRKPWIPDGQFLTGDFSENLSIELLNKIKK